MIRLTLRDNSSVYIMVRKILHFSKSYKPPHDDLHCYVAIRDGGHWVRETPEQVAELVYKVL